MTRLRTTLTRVGRLVGALLCVGAAGYARPEPSEAQAPGPPTLVVALVVDQLRADVLERYDEVFTGGIRRVVDQGHHFTQASHAHARTSTAPGHATLATGVLPSGHGVVANSWYQRRGSRWDLMYAVADADSPILGFENEEVLEGRSPKSILRSGLPDWIMKADADARVVAISKKDRAAVPLGGQHSEHVYWLLPELGRFITSTYYRDEYPRWLTRFNERVMPGIAEVEVWESEVPHEYRGLARADEAPYEGDGQRTVFPHVSAQETFGDTTRMQHNVWAFDQPRADAAVVALAREAVDELELGQREVTDYLGISLSAVDRVGHAYGPFSQEVLSTLIHADRLLDDFFDHLDEEVGEGRWLVGLSSDHGVATMPEAARAWGDQQADRIARDTVLARLNVALQEAAREGGGPDQIAARLARGLEEEGVVARAYTHHELTRGGTPSDSFAVLYRNSYYPGRAWDDLSRFGVDLRYGEGDYVGSQTGTSHETPYWYDRHVPMIFMGAGVEAGKTDTPVYTVDFAPTLAGLAGIPIPDDLDGRRVY